MEEFYKKHNLSKSHFAALLKMDPKSLTKYEHSEKLGAGTVYKIELGIDVMTEYNIRFPRYMHFMEEEDYSVYKDKVKDTDALFKMLYAIEA